MAKFYDEIPEWLFEWILKQQMFFVATAPLNEHGHINVSPKGTADCFHVVNSKQAWYEDLSGSGVETISHIRENGRITIMFCAFEGPPRILRLWGVGTVHEYGSPEYNRLIPPTSRKPGSRAVVFIDIYQVGSSCGFAVPLYDFVMHRTQLLRLSDKLEMADRALAAAGSCDQPAVLCQSNGHTQSATEGGNNAKQTSATSGFSLRKYWLLKNQRSLDGLPGLLTAPDAMLEMAPQSNFDRDGVRPLLHHVASKGHGGRATEDGKWFASGLLLGAVAAFAATTIVDRVKG